MQPKMSSTKTTPSKLDEIEIEIPEVLRDDEAATGNDEARNYLHRFDKVRIQRSQQQLHH
ncbi:hypothetical protein C1H46_004909 [Malus baccata]|uniref:Uncharacterized protein n=1 Tax=Malus baccata TaxID=106549 RepID=A0A540NEH6_MALBA|nr:hypothetical protein C1H46_004909 [Malus baccata]